MQLLALKRISGKRPKGATFDEPATVGRFLIAKGLAKAVTVPPPAAAPAPAPDPVVVEATNEPLEAPDAIVPDLLADDTEPAGPEGPVGVTPPYSRRGRGRRSESPA
jgi:hypothetical protein